MTKKLRCKFIWITMTITTVMLCIIMSIIYVFTKMNLENNSIHMLQNIAMNPFLLRVPGELSGEVRLPYFTLQIIAQGGVNCHRRRLLRPVGRDIFKRLDRCHLFRF